MSPGLGENIVKAEDNMGGVDREAWGRLSSTRCPKDNSCREVTGTVLGSLH